MDFAERTFVAYHALRHNGLGAAAATGVVGNLVVESRIDPRAIGDGGLAHGICQWHPDRWSALLHFAAVHSANPYDLAVQVAFAVREAAWPAGGHCWQLLAGETRDITVDEAADIWMRRFERPADQSTEAARRRADAGTAAVHDMRKPDDLHVKPHWYVVRAGDTLTAIAGRHHLSVNDLRPLNPHLFDAQHHHGDLIRPGEHVRLS